MSTDPFTRGRGLRITTGDPPQVATQLFGRTGVSLWWFRGHLVVDLSDLAGIRRSRHEHPTPWAASELAGSCELALRGSAFFDLAKSGLIRLARIQAAELRRHGVAAVALTPGFLRSEAVLDHFGVTAAGWRDAIARDSHFAYSETPAFLGRAVAALAADPDVMSKTAGSLATWDLAAECGFCDADGTRPDWGAHFRSDVVPNLAGILEDISER